MKTIDLTSMASGFCGYAYDPGPSATRAVIVVTGSDGGIENAKHIAKLFAENGLLALAIGYFGLPHLSRRLSLIPLEMVERAVGWLQQYDSGRIAEISAYGLSKGTEMVLLSSILFPQIKRVVAVVPNSYVCAGLRRGLPPYAGQSSWSFRGKPVPHAPIPFCVGRFLRVSLRERQYRIAAFYECALDCGIPDAAWIPAEKSHAHLLFLSASDDSMWPSNQASQHMMARLDAAQYPYAYQHINFEHGSHLLSPMPDAKIAKLGFAMRSERTRPEGCAQARKDAFAISVDWLTRSFDDINVNGENE